MELRDRVRTETVLQRLNWRLSWGMVPARQQREIVRELRAISPRLPARAGSTRHSNGSDVPASLPMPTSTPCSRGHGGPPESLLRARPWR